MTVYRRKHLLVPVSFFAFQDIITALAGCMLIFVLALAAAKSRSAGNAAAEKTAPRSEYDKLQSTIKLKRSILQAEESEIAALRSQIDRSELNEQNRKLNNELESSGRKLEKIAGERAQLLEKLQSELAALQKQNQQLKFEDQELAKLIERAKLLEKEYHDQRKKLRFADSKTRNNIILTVSRGNWYYQDKVHEKARAVGNSINALPQLKAKLGKLDLRHTRLIIAVRPSAGGFAGTLKKSLQNSFPKLEIVAEPLLHETAGGLDL